jgi:DNA-binding HxlR family transcriptional regulator
LVRFTNNNFFELPGGIDFLVYGFKGRFSDILNDIEGISNRMLSKELKELEINQLVKQTVLNIQPITVQYELTKHGNTLQTIISNLTESGTVHRKKIVGK